MISNDNVGRFTTNNTNLAACIGALRVPLKTVQNTETGVWHPDYISVYKDGETGKRTIFWHFEEAGEEYEARSIESFWRNKESFEAENPEHPLIPMRRGLEKLGWLTKVWHGEIKPATRENIGLQFETDDIALAACLMGIGHSLYSVRIAMNEKGERIANFIFVGIDKSSLDAFANYRYNAHPIAQMRLAIEVRALLLKELRRPDVMTLVRYQNGDPLKGGKTMDLIEGKATEAEIELLLTAFYEQ